MTTHAARRMLVHTMRAPIRWGDMDALGHVNNTVYFRYMEQARVEWLAAQQPGGEPFGRDGIVIINASCTFLEPLVYPGDVEVKMYLGDPGRTSVGSYYDIASGRPEPLPDRIVAPLRAHAIG